MSWEPDIDQDWTAVYFCSTTVTWQNYQQHWQRCFEKLKLNSTFVVTAYSHT